MTQETSLNIHFESIPGVARTSQTPPAAPAEATGSASAATAARLKQRWGAKLQEKYGGFLCNTYEKYVLSHEKYGGFLRGILLEFWNFAEIFHGVNKKNTLASP